MSLTTSKKSRRAEDLFAKWLRCNQYFGSGGGSGSAEAEAALKSTASKTLVVILLKCDFLILCLRCALISHSEMGVCRSVLSSVQNVGRFLYLSACRAHTHVL